MLLLIWQNVIVTYYSSKDITDVAPAYEGRISLDVDIAKGKANLKLFSISLADNKEFECRVLIPLDDTGKVADTARLVVLGNLLLNFVYMFFIFFWGSLYSPGSWWL